MSLQDLKTKIVGECITLESALLYGTILHELTAYYGYRMPDKGEISLFMLNLMQEYCSPIDQKIYMENWLLNTNGKPLDIYKMAVTLIKEHKFT